MGSTEFYLPEPNSFYPSQLRKPKISSDMAKDFLSYKITYLRTTLLGDTTSKIMRGTATTKPLGQAGVDIL
jgi:hypothetical protein